MASSSNTAGSSKSISDPSAGNNAKDPGSKGEESQSMGDEKTSDSTSPISEEKKVADETDALSSLPPPPRRKSQGALVTLPADKDTQGSVSQLQRLKTHSRQNTLGIPIPGRLDRGGQRAAINIPDDGKPSDHEGDSSTES